LKKVLAALLGFSEPPVIWCPVRFAPLGKPLTEGSVASLPAKNAFTRESVANNKATGKKQCS